MQPASWISPYYKRATKIGVPEAGIVKVHNALTSLITNINVLKAERDNNDDTISALQLDIERFMEEMQYQIASTQPKSDPQLESNGEAGSTSLIENNPEEPNDLKAFFEEVQLFLKEMKNKIDLTGNERWNELAGAMAPALVKSAALNAQLGLIKDAVAGKPKLMSTISRIHEKAVKNSKKIHAYLKGIADKHLGQLADTCFGTRKPCASERHPWRGGVVRALSHIPAPARAVSRYNNKE